MCHEQSEYFREHRSDNRDNKLPKSFSEMAQRLSNLSCVITYFTAINLNEHGVFYVKAKLYIYNPDIPIRSADFTSTVQELTLLRSHLPRKNAAHFLQV